MILRNFITSVRSPFLFFSTYIRIANNTFHQKALSVLGVLFFLLFSTSSFGQFENSPDSTFYSFLNSFYQNHTDDGAEGGMYNHVRRDALTWGGRLFPSGDMRVANRAMIDYAKSFNNQELKNSKSTVRAIQGQLPNNHPNANGWTELGPTGPQNYSSGHQQNTARGMGQMHRIAFHPDYGTTINGVLNETLYAGSHYGGLFRSDNAGASWYNFHTDNGLPITSIGGVAVSENKVYACTGNGDFAFTFGYQATYEPLRSSLGSNPLHTQGVYRYDHSTTNQWESINGKVAMIDGTTAPSLLDVFMEGGTMRNIIVHPNNDNTVLIATSHGIFRSTNSGNNWKQVLIGPSTTTWDTEWRGLKYHPTQTKTVYASGKDIYESTDGGNTWNSKTNGLQKLALPSSFAVRRINIAVTPDQPDMIYAQVVGDTGRRLYLYDGTNWILKFQLNTYQAENASWNGIAVSPTDGSKVYIGILDNYRFDNFLGTPSGYNINPSGGGHYPEIHDDVHTLVFPPNNNSELFVGTHGGVSKYNTLTGAWTALYDGLGVSTIWSFDDWEGKHGVIAIAKQDAGIDYTIDNGQTWLANLLIGDGYGVQIDDHTGLAFWLGNWYVGATQIYPTFDTPNDISPFKPIDNGTVSADIPTTFKMINHPKTEELYFGATELHQRDFLTLTEQSAAGGVYPWTKKSNLAQVQNSLWDQWKRQIMEVAFSEDDNTDIAYISTLNYNHPVNPGFRSGFFVSNPNSPTDFIDKTSFLPISTNSSIPSNITEPNPVTGIAVDPKNGDRVWTSFTGFDPKIKVYYSASKGDANTWVSYDDSNESLEKLNMPVNGIVYQRGTNDRLYIATDVGVYVREGTGDWLRFDNASNPFPNTRVTELKINYCSGKLLAATFGRGVWEADLLPAENDISLRSFRTVSTNETWTENKNMSRDIRVKAGVKLVLKDMTLNMPENGLIVIEQGGELEVDGSTITNACDNTWHGIQIWGNSSLPQTGSNQGLLTLNDATIEYAKESMTNWEAGNYTHTGGIIKAKNSSFINNWGTAGFIKYNSPVGQREASYFRNCVFTVNDDYRSFNTIDNSFLGHLTMWDIGGLGIYGCTFEDVRTLKTGEPNTDGSFGIFALAATPQIRSLALGSITGPFQRNIFRGLERAIDIGNPSSQPFTVLIDQSDFIGNEQAIELENMGLNIPKVIRNTFEIGAYDTQNPSSQGVVEEYGLGIIATTNYIVEQNEFNGTSNEPIVGSWIDGTGSAANQIFNNDYKELSFGAGNLAHGFNGEDVINPGGGVQYLCNNNTKNYIDFGVLSNPNSTNNTPSIAPNQGSISEAAQNSFSPSAGLHFINLNPTAINYWYANIALFQEPDNNKIMNVLKQSASASLAFCSDRYGDILTPNSTSSISDIPGPALKPYKMKKEYEEALSQYNELVEEYRSLLDGEHFEEITNSSERTSVQNSEETETTKLLSRIAKQNATIHFWANELYIHYANDTDGPLYNSLEESIKNKPSLSSEYDLVEHYWQQKRYADAFNQIDAIQEKYNLEEEAYENHGDYRVLKSILYEADLEGRNLAQLKRNEVEKLKSLANRKIGFASTSAKNIVEFFYGNVEKYYPILPEIAEGNSNRNQDESQKVIESNTNASLSAYPNPSIDWANLEYELPRDISKGILTITSSAGQRIETIIINENKGTINLNTEQWTKGIYYAIIHFGAENKSPVLKLIITK